MAFISRKAKIAAPRPDHQIQVTPQVTRKAA